MALSREYILLTIGLLLAVMLVIGFTIRGVNLDISRAETTKAKSVDKYAEIANWRLVLPVDNMRVTESMFREDGVVPLKFRILGRLDGADLIVQVDDPAKTVHILGVDTAPDSDSPAFSADSSNIQVEVPMEDVKATEGTYAGYVYLYLSDPLTVEHEVRLVFSVGGAAKTVLIIFEPTETTYAGAQAGGGAENMGTGVFIADTWDGSYDQDYDGIIIIPFAVNASYGPDATVNIWLHDPDGYVIFAGADPEPDKEVPTGAWSMRYELPMGGAWAPPGPGPEDNTISIDARDCGMYIQISQVGYMLNYNASTDKYEGYLYAYLTRPLPSDHTIKLVFEIWYGSGQTDINVRYVTVKKEIPVYMPDGDKMAEISLDGTSIPSISVPWDVITDMYQVEATHYEIQFRMYIDWLSNDDRIRIRLFGTEIDDQTLWLAVMNINTTSVSVAQQRFDNETVVASRDFANIVGSWHDIRIVIDSEGANRRVAVFFDGVPIVSDWVAPIAFPESVKINIDAIRNPPVDGAMIHIDDIQEILEATGGLKVTVFEDFRDSRNNVISSASLVPESP